MEFEINSSPHLEMADITKKLFNRNFHSDVQFSVQGKIIYAHSLKLIERSVVFEKQFGDTIGHKKWIPINDYKYESFLEFIRFIYTDECDINENNLIDILKLATTYQVIKMENRVINSGVIGRMLKIFEHCVCNKYELARNMVNEFIAGCFARYIADKQFISLHPDALEELLKFERIEKRVTELQIFIAVAEWISFQCKIHQITLSDGRQRWDKLIRKIRFPTMAKEELRICFTKYSGLLSDRDFASIMRQAILGECTVNDLWISNGRKEFIYPSDFRHLRQIEDYKTIFTVSMDVILYGLRIGGEVNMKPIQIEILGTDDKTSINQKLTFVHTDQNIRCQAIISLGQSLRFKPNFKYTISINFLELNGDFFVVCRRDGTEVIINDSAKAVNLIQASPNLLEMFFKPVKV